MPLSTGSQISVTRDKTSTRDHRSRLPPPPSCTSARLRNPHDGRNEHKQRLASSGDQSARSQTSVELVDSEVEEKKKEGVPLVMKQSTALPSQTDATEEEQGWWGARGEFREWKVWEPDSCVREGPADGDEGEGSPIVVLRQDRG